MREIVLDTETTGLDPLRSDLVGISFSISGKTGFYVPVNAGRTTFS